MDLTLRDVRVIDGTGRASYRADVGIESGRVTAIEREGSRRLTGRVNVEGDGLALCPGFIDMHAHSDLALLTDPAHEAKVAQGVTLEVIGQDGLSYAPVDDLTLEAIRHRLTSWNDDPPGFDWNWRSVGEYLDRLDHGFGGAGIAVNAAYLVPHGMVRALTVGWSPRAATQSELERMRRLVAQGLAEGAVGLSAGLTHSPGMYASTAELTELCRVTASYGGYFCPHQRSYGVGALDAYQEMLAVAREAGCALHLAHATLNFPINRGRAPELLALLDAALDLGIDVTLDSYPYLPGFTTLATLLPSWASEGGPEATLARLRDQVISARIREVLEKQGSDGCHGVPVDWDTVEVSGVSERALRRYVGLTVRQAAHLDGVAPFEMTRRLLVEDKLATTVLQHVGHEENVRAVMRHRTHTGGSDGVLVGARPHPRAFGTFPRYLGTYVRELGVLGLEECVAHLTSRPAMRLRLPDRGLIREGYRADLVLFDPETVGARATFDAPKRPPTGIVHVLIDGRFAIRHGLRTDVLAGRSIRRAPSR